MNKAFSIDPETFLILDRYCAASETWDKRRSRSAVVNNAIKWYITGNVDELIEDHKKLKEQYDRVCNELYGNKPSQKSWWRRLLGLN